MNYNPNMEVLKLISDDSIPFQLLAIVDSKEWETFHSFDSGNVVFEMSNTKIFEKEFVAFK